MTSSSDRFRTTIQGEKDTGYVKAQPLQKQLDLIWAAINTLEGRNGTVNTLNGLNVTGQLTTTGRIGAEQSNPIGTIHAVTEATAETNVQRSNVGATIGFPPTLALTAGPQQVQHPSLGTVYPTPTLAFMRDSSSFASSVTQAYIQGVDPNGLNIFPNSPASSQSNFIIHTTGGFSSDVPVGYVTAITVGGGGTGSLTIDGNPHTLTWNTTPNYAGSSNGSLGPFISTSDQINFNLNFFGIYIVSAQVTIINTSTTIDQAHMFIDITGSPSTFTPHYARAHGDIPHNASGTNPVTLLATGVVVYTSGPIPAINVSYTSTQSTGSATPGTVAGDNFFFITKLA